MPLTTPDARESFEPPKEDPISVDDEGRAARPAPRPVERKQEFAGLAGELAAKIRRQAFLTGIEGKFSPLIRIRENSGSVRQFNDGPTNRGNGPATAMHVLLNGHLDANTGYDSVGYFGTATDYYGKNQRDWEKVLLERSAFSDYWYNCDDRESRDLFELLPLGNGRSLVRVGFTHGIASAMEARRGANKFLAIVPDNLAAEIWDRVKTDPSLILPIIHEIYPLSGTPLTDVEVRELLNQHAQPGQKIDNKILARIKAASVIDRREAQTGVYMIDGRRPELAPYAKKSNDYSRADLKKIFEASYVELSKKGRIQPQPLPAETVAVPVLPAPPAAEIEPPQKTEKPPTPAIPGAEFFSDLPQFDKPDWEVGVNAYIGRHTQVLGTLRQKFDQEKNLSIGDRAILLACISHMYYLVENWPKNAKSKLPADMVTKLNSLTLKIMGGNK